MEKETWRAAMLTRHNGEAGLMPVGLNRFLESSKSWVGTLGTVGLAHGAVGCGAFGLTERLRLSALRKGSMESEKCSKTSASACVYGGCGPLHLSVDYTRFRRLGYF